MIRRYVIGNTKGALAVKYGETARNLLRADGADLLKEYYPIVYELVPVELDELRRRARGKERNDK